MPIIIIIIMAVYLVLISWTWYSLENIDKPKKVIIIIVGIFISYILTLIIFNFSKRGIDYGNMISQSTIKNILITIFTGINGILFIPYISKILGKLNEDEIDNNFIRKRIIILLLLFIICISFEYGYLKDIQKGIINIYNYTYEKTILINS